MNKLETPTPYWRLSGFYLSYFASLGALLPYWSVYLKSLSFSPREIGELMAILMATKIVSPNIWAWIADHTGKRMMIVQLGSLLSVLAFTGILLGSSYWWIALVMVTFSFFWNATLPQFEANTFTYLGEHSHRYSSIRLWGSIGFVVTAIALGSVLEQYGTGQLPIILVGLFASIWLMSLLVPERAAAHMSLEHEPLITVLKRPEVFSLIIVVFLMQASHGPYYTFYTIYMEDHHYERSLVGQLWALGVIAEVIVFLFMYKIVPRFGLRLMLISSLILAAVRWLLIGWFVDYIVVMIIAQLLHAATFGIYHAAAIQLFNKYFTGRHQGRGQALYSSMSFGLGGAVGALISGYTWETVGAGISFTIAAGLSVIAGFVAWRYIKN